MAAAHIASSAPNAPPDFPRGSGPKLRNRIDDKRHDGIIAHMTKR